MSRQLEGILGMKLFKVHVKHYSPKDSHTSVEGFLIRETEREVCDYVSMKLGYMDEKDMAEEVESYDDDGEDDGDDENVEPETKRDRLMRFHGELFDPDADVSDLYYGATQYGWEDMGEATAATIEVLRQCKALLGDESKDEEHQG
jgi:hypothetical protein